jgi:hypothetical protein
MIQLTATLQDNPPGLFIGIPNDLVASFGAGKRPAVVATVNGIEVRTRIMVYGGQSLIGLSKAFRAEHELHPGQDVELTIALDQAPREIELPADFAEALAADPEAQAAFDRLSFTNRKEYAVWIDSAKRADTRQRRLAEAPAMLKGGRKTPL